MFQLFWDYAPEDLEVQVSELLVASAEDSDALIDESVSQVLQQLREHLHMDVIFVSEITEGRRIFRHVDERPGRALIATGGSSPLEQSFCQFVIDGRLPRLVRNVARAPQAKILPATAFPIGAHLSTPIVLSDGRIYGTLCCFSQAADDGLAQRDLDKLECVARLLAKRLNLQRARQIEHDTAHWALEPKAEEAVPPRHRR